MHVENLFHFCEVSSFLLKSQFLYIHLAQKLPWRFLKLAMCKFPTTVNDSEIHILLPKPYSLMWTLCAEIVWEMAVIEGPNVSPKSRTFENSYGQCAVQHRALWNKWWHGWWAQRLGVAETAVESESFMLIQWVRAYPRGSIISQSL